MWKPATTESGLAMAAIYRSADVVTVLVVVPDSLPGFTSAVDEPTIAVFVRTVAAAVAGATATVSVKTALPTPNEGCEQEMAPAAPTAGTVHDHPPGDESDTKVVPAGSVSVSAADAAWLGPLLVAVMV